MFWACALSLVLMIYQGTNTYIVGQGLKRLLVDAGEGKEEWLTSLKEVVEKEKIVIDKAILTHWHHDHIQGVHDLLEYSPNTKIFKKDPHDGWFDLSDGQIFKTEGTTVRCLFCPGHTDDHMAFILEEEDAMFTGDNVLGHGTTVFEDLSAYMKSLDSMLQQFSGRAYPGHGAVIEDGPARIHEYIKHRKLREKQVLDVLASNKEKKWAPMEIVTIIYKDYSKTLWEHAERGIVQILEKLQNDGKVLHKDKEGTWSMSGKASL